MEFSTRAQCIGPDRHKQLGKDPVPHHSGFINIRLRLDRVVEIHVAGGSSRDGFLLDSHSEVVPDPVWRLLEAVVPRAPHLAGIVFELLDEAFSICRFEQAVLACSPAVATFTPETKAIQSDTRFTAVVTELLTSGVLSLITEIE